MWEEKQTLNEKMNTQFLDQAGLVSGQHFLPGLVSTFPGQQVGDTRKSQRYLRLHKQDGNCGHQLTSQSLDPF